MAHLASAPTGLSSLEAGSRAARHGLNVIPEPPSPGLFRRLIAQFRNVLIYVLLAAATGAALMQRVKDALVILAVVGVNALVGLIQEGRAERALAGIRSLVGPQASVLRDGVRVTLAAEQIVPGDVVVLEAGDRVPADMRLIRASSLRIEEAALTGEAIPTEKQVAPVAADAVLGDRASMAFCGTLVVAGSATGLVVATGAVTELGRIGALVAAVKRPPTPLVRQMDAFARQLTLAVGVLGAATFAMAFWMRGYPAVDAFMIVIGLAVAAIPEGLPAVMTIALSIGVTRMAARRAVVRHMPAVETLGSVSVICSDKTGTLTRNEMIVTSVVLADGAADIEGVGYAPVGLVTIRAGGSLEMEGRALADVAAVAALCNDGRIEQAGDDWLAHGDPMEAALLAFAGKLRPDAQLMRKKSRRLDEIPFDPTRRYMATLQEAEGAAARIFVKGSPERVMAMCSGQMTRQGVTPVDLDFWHKAVHALASQGDRVLALAAKDARPGCTKLGAADVESGLVLLAVVGLADPPREEAVAAVLECRRAGIAVKMITGDHAETALAIARQLDLADDPEVVTGRDIERLTDEELVVMADRVSVFARTSPGDKLRLVQALQRHGHVVAMTGDGVNDAPALKQADVGVAMGRKGTEAAKAAAQVVLVDDNFASIVAAVREGRTVYDNLKKVIAMVLPTNGGETAALLIAVLFGFALPITPVQLLWVNMVTGAALELTLAFEPGEPGAMRRPPRSRSEPLLTGQLWWQVLYISAVFVAGTTGVFFWSRAQGEELAHARTMVVNTLVVMQVFYLFSVRYLHGSSITWRALLGTPAVLIGVAAAAVGQIALTYVPWFNRAFGTRPLAGSELLIVVAIGVATLLLAEVEKPARRWLLARIASP